MSLVERVQAALEKGAGSTVAALFIVAFFWLLSVHVRSIKAHSRTLATLDEAHDAEVAALNAELRKVSIEQATLIGTTEGALRELRKLKRTPRKRKVDAEKTVIDVHRAVADGGDTEDG